MSKRVYAGTLEDHSPEQAQVLQLLREHLTQSGVTNKRFDDRYLLRFCRARKFDFPKVKLMFENFLKWRRDNSVDEVAKFDISPMYAAFDILPHNYYCLDREGRPVYMERYKDFDLKDLKEKVGEDFVIKYYIYGYERLVNLTFPFLSKKSGKHIEQSVTILDLDGLNFTKIFSKRNEIQAFLKLSSSIAQDNYPEMMGRLFIINAPFVFGMLWSLVKGFLDERTQKKISVLSSSYKSELTKVISEEELPDWLGGKNKRTLKQGCFDDLFA